MWTVNGGEASVGRRRRMSAGAACGLSRTKGDQAGPGGRPGRWLGVRARNASSAGKSARDRDTRYTPSRQNMRKHLPIVSFLLMSASAHFRGTASSHSKARPHHSAFHPRTCSMITYAIPLIAARSSSTAARTDRRVGRIWPDG